jgi:hypothetical protein
VRLRHILNYLTGAKVSDEVFDQESEEPDPEMEQSAIHDEGAGPSEEDLATQASAEQIAEAGPG